MHNAPLEYSDYAQFPERRSRTDGKEAEYQRNRRMRSCIGIVQILLFVAFVFLVMLQPVSVQGISMQPTLQQNELLLIDRLAMYLHTPQRGDIVVFSHPTNGTELIKRVIAFAGETVQIVDGQVYINGYLLDESAYLTPQSGNMEPIIVPDSYVFVLGDNRSESIDSRDSSLGCIPLSSLHGTVRMRVSPIGHTNLYLIMSGNML